MGDTIYKPIGFPMPMLEKVDELAGKKNKSRAEIVRIAVRELIKKEKEQN